MKLPCAGGLKFESKGAGGSICLFALRRTAERKEVARDMNFCKIFASERKI